MEGRCKATWKKEFKLPWREAGPPNIHDDEVDMDERDVDTELSLWHPQVLHPPASGHVLHTGAVWLLFQIIHRRLPLPSAPSTLLLHVR